MNRFIVFMFFVAGFSVSAAEQPYPGQSWYDPLLYKKSARARWAQDAQGANAGMSAVAPMDVSRNPNAQFAQQRSARQQQLANQQQARAGRQRVAQAERNMTMRARKAARVPAMPVQQQAEIAMPAPRAEVMQQLPAAVTASELSMPRALRSQDEVNAMSGMSTAQPIDYRAQRNQAYEQLKPYKPRRARSQAEVDALAGMSTMPQVDYREERNKAYENLDVPIAPQPRVPRSQVEMDAMAGVSSLQPVDYKKQREDAYEKAHELATRNYWTDYYTQKEKEAEKPGSIRSRAYNFGKDEYDRYFGKPRVRDYVRAYNPRKWGSSISRAEDYDNAYVENSPRYGNRAWELENAYGVPYTERLSSRVSPYTSSLSNKIGQGYNTAKQGLSSARSYLGSAMPTRETFSRSSAKAAQEAQPAQPVNANQPGYFERFRNWASGAQDAAAETAKSYGPYMRGSLAGSMGEMGETAENARQGVASYMPTRETFSNLYNRATAKAAQEAQPVQPANANQSGYFARAQNFVSRNNPFASKSSGVYSAPLHESGELTPEELQEVEIAEQFKPSTVDAYEIPTWYQRVGNKVSNVFSKKGPAYLKPLHSGDEEEMADAEVEEE